jgi:FlaA1/EpsC-like NDP-sugar epimerase
VLLDLVLITVAYYTAYFLRFEGSIGQDLHMFLNSLPVVIACQILSFYLMGVYRGVWESTGLRDLIGYIKAVTIGTVLPILILLGIYRFQSFSRAVFAIYWFLMLVLISLSRLSFRMFEEGIRKGERKGKPTLIYGAGVGGQMTLKEIETNQDLGMVPVGFVDDNPRIHGRKIKGYPVFGGQEDLKKIIKKHKIKEVIVSFRESGLEKKKEIRKLCVSMGAEVEVKQMQLILS